jgi:transcriptional regulator with XRE-family HTH domain
MDTGIEIKTARKEKGWQQKELAEMVGISPSALSLIENGKRQPTFEQRNKISRALGVHFGSPEEEPESDAPPSRTDIISAISSYPKLEKKDKRILIEMFKSLERAWEAKNEEPW